MYARGMRTCEIQGRLRELYGLDVSLELISIVTRHGVGEGAGVAEPPS